MVSYGCWLDGKEGNALSGSVLVVDDADGESLAVSLTVDFGEGTEGAVLDKPILGWKRRSVNS